MRRIVCALIIFVMLLGLAACNRKPQPEAPEETPRSDAQSPVQSPEPVYQEQEKNTVKLQIRESVSVFPWDMVQMGYDELLCDLLYDGLLQMEAGESQNIKGNIAESWSHSDDLLNWTFVLKKGVYFSDGTECNAKAVERCWNYYLEQNDSLYFFTPVQSWEAVGDYELEIHLSQACPWFEQLLCSYEFCVMSPDALENNTGAAATAGTGPYVLKDYTVNEYGRCDNCLLVKNENYCGSADEFPLDEIELVTLYGVSETFDMLSSGELDCAVLEMQDLQNAVSRGEYDGSLEYNDFSLEVYYGFGGTQTGCCIWLNPTVCEPLMDINVRKAICMSVDLEAVSKALCFDHAKVQSSIWSDESAMSVPYEGLEYDPQEGLRLLEEAGYSAGNISFSVMAMSSEKAAFEVIRDNLAQIGIEVIIEVWKDEWSSTRYDNAYALNIGYNNYLQLTREGSYISERWNSILQSVDAPFAILKHSWQEIYDPELYAQMCEIYERMMSTSDCDEMVECARELTRIVQEDYTALPFIQEPVFVAVRKGAEIQYEALSQTSVFQWMYR